MPGRPVPSTQRRVVLRCLVLLACSRPAPPPAWGQWVWTAEDAEVLRVAQAKAPVAVGVHVATTRWADGGFKNDLGLPPTAAGPGPVAVVIRLDDSVHAAWDAAGDEAVRAGLDDALGRVMALVRARGVPMTELQLDYDVPVRLIPRWAAVLGQLRRGALAGVPVWVTSLVAHVRDPAYGPAMRGVADGHILQVFDTGDDPGTASEIAGYAATTGLPYRLGVGAFERGGDHPTQHRAWFSALAVACPAPRCEAVWVFPAGRTWAELIPSP